MTILISTLIAIIIVVIVVMVSIVSNKHGSNMQSLVSVHIDRIVRGHYDCNNYQKQLLLWYNKYNLDHHQA